MSWLSWPSWAFWLHGHQQLRIPYPDTQDCSLKSPQLRILSWLPKLMVIYFVDSHFINSWTWKSVSISFSDFFFISCILCNLRHAEPSSLFVKFVYNYCKSDWLLLWVMLIVQFLSSIERMITSLNYRFGEAEERCKRLWVWPWNYLSSTRMKLQNWNQCSNYMGHYHMSKHVS